MVQVKVDESAMAFLGPLKEHVELIDGDGVVLGYFAPAPPSREGLRRKAFAEYDPERARKRRESPEGGFTTEQVQAHLKSLGSS